MDTPFEVIFTYPLSFERITIKKKLCVRAMDTPTVKSITYPLSFELVSLFVMTYIIDHHRYTWYYCVGEYITCAVNESAVRGLFLL